LVIARTSIAPELVRTAVFSSDSSRMPVAQAVGVTPPAALASTFNSPELVISPEIRPEAGAVPGALTQIPTASAEAKAAVPPSAIAIALTFIVPELTIGSGTLLPDT